MRKNYNKNVKYIKKVMAIVLLVCFCLILTLSEVYINNDSHEKTLNSIANSSRFSNSEVENILRDSITSNMYLSNEEKEVILGYVYIFVNNKNYLDLEYFKKILNTLRINYDKNINYKSKMHKTNGSYNSSENVITFYGAENVSDIKSIFFTHELFHTMQKNYNKNYNSYLIESVNTIFNEEYSGLTENSIYDEYYNYVKMLIEIIGIEPFKKYECYAYVGFITDELIKITGSEVEATLLLTNMDNYKKIYDRISYDSKTYNSDLTKLDKLDKKILNEINIYYKAKYGIDMKNDLIMLSYYDNRSFLIEVENKYLSNASGKNILILQTYLMSYFINDKSLNEIQLLYSVPLESSDNKDGTKVIIINKENRYLISPK
jgi:hypothetical protein